MCGEMIWAVVDGLSNRPNFRADICNAKTRNIILESKYFSTHSIKVTFLEHKKRKEQFLFPPTCCQLRDINKTREISKRLNWH